jgi:hypothetical protein
MKYDDLYLYENVISLVSFINEKWFIKFSS